MNFERLQMILAPAGRYRALLSLVGAYDDAMDVTLYALKRDWSGMAKVRVGNGEAECKPMVVPGHGFWSIKTHVVDYAGRNWFVVVDPTGLSMALIGEDYMRTASSDKDTLQKSFTSLRAEYACVCTIDTAHSLAILTASIHHASMHVYFFKTDVIMHLNYIADVYLDGSSECIELGVNRILVTHSSSKHTRAFTVYNYQYHIEKPCDAFAKMKLYPQHVIGIGEVRALFTAAPLEFTANFTDTPVFLWDFLQRDKLTIMPLCKGSIKWLQLATVDRERVLVYGGRAGLEMNTKFYIFNHATGAAVVIDGAPSNINDCVLYKPRERWRHRERLFVCASCGLRSSRMYMCNACKGACYCNDECQRRHWKAHKADCNKK